MAAQEIRAEYEELGRIADEADEQQEETQRLMRQINDQMQTLRGGSWVGENANQFYENMESDVLPAVQRLANALGAMNNVTRQIIQILKNAEEEAANVFPSA